MPKTVGSILHGAYGDYYEQLVGLREIKRQRPDIRLHLYAANPARMRDLQVFDLDFAERIASAAELPDQCPDEFHQYQVLDQELRDDVLAKLPSDIVARIRPDLQRLPWTDLRHAWRAGPEACDLPLTESGHAAFLQCVEENRAQAVLRDDRPTIGFLWRYRSGGANSAVSAVGQRSAQELIDEVSTLLRTLIEEFDAHILVCGMGVETTEQNIHRIDRKYTAEQLDLPVDRVTYLQGLGWSLEVEIIRRCTACLLMASGFSEAVWMKRHGQAVVLYEPPPHYLLKLLRHRMPLFGGPVANAMRLAKLRRGASQELRQLVSDRASRRARP